MRPIDADALKKRILEERDKIPLTIPAASYELVAKKANSHGNSMRGGIRIALRCMEQTPTIEAEPVRHGRWISSPFGLYACSVCGVNDLFGLSSNCPNCRAKMYGGGEYGNLQG